MYFGGAVQVPVLVRVPAVLLYVVNDPAVLFLKAYFVAWFHEREEPSDEASCGEHGLMNESVGH